MTRPCCRKRIGIDGKRGQSEFLEGGVDQREPLGERIPR